MNNKFKEQINDINCILSEIDGLYHDISLMLGLSDSVSRILYYLYINNGECPLSEIYKRSGIGKQTINSAIRKLEKDEIILLMQLDKKSKLVKLTKKGIKYTKTTTAKLVELELNAYKCWSEEEILQYLVLSQKFKQDFNAEIEKLKEEL